MKIRNYDKEHDKIELQMTPMIDIVFQLLVFFIMTFKIVTQEGDFNIKMPLAAVQQSNPEPPSVPPVKIRLRASEEGILAAVVMNDRVMPGDTVGDKFTYLHNEILGMLGDEVGPGSLQEEAEVEFDCDYGLHYRYVIEAITSVSGYINQEGQTVKLVERIKFAPPRDPG